MPLKKKYIILSFLFFNTLFNLRAEIAMNNPYSGYGIGEISNSLLSQNRALGGLAASIRKIGKYNNINPGNPASYSAIKITTFDVGVNATFNELTKNTFNPEQNFNASINNFIVAIPVTTKSALSFGLMPYSTVGYQNKKSGTIDTSAVNYVSTGEGGISKLYIGYGMQVIKDVSIGVNVNYLFGVLKYQNNIEFQTIGPLNTRLTDKKQIRGFQLEIGTQYHKALSEKTQLNIGYVIALASNPLLKQDQTMSRYFKNPNTGVESLAADSVYHTQGESLNLSLPHSHKIGFSIEHRKRWLVGAEFMFTQWSKFREGNDNPNLKDAYGIGLGTQFTPDIDASSYLETIDYRVGFRYDKSYININSTDIQQTTLSVGLGLPLPANRIYFSKINVTAELGQRGTLDNSLVRERFLNIRLGFTLNEQWFIKPKYD